MYSISQYNSGQIGVVIRNEKDDDAFRELCREHKADYTFANFRYTQLHTHSDEWKDAFKDGMVYFIKRSSDGHRYAVFNCITNHPGICVELRELDEYYAEPVCEFDEGDFLSMIK